MDAVSLATGWHLATAQTSCWSRLKRSLKLWLLLRDAASLSPRGRVVAHDGELTL